MCSAAATEFDSGALATMIPRLVAAAMSTLSTPVPARPITFSRSARAISSAVILVAERIRIASNSPIRALELRLVPVEPELDVELRTQQVDAGVGDLLLHQDPRHGVGHALALTAGPLIVGSSRPRARSRRSSRCTL